jgi:hypothetical protein
LFVLQLSRFKTYPHADAKQRKTKKWPNPVIQTSTWLFIDRYLTFTFLIVNSQVDHHTNQYYNQHCKEGQNKTEISVSRVKVVSPVTHHAG